MSPPSAINNPAANKLNIRFLLEKPNIIKPNDNAANTNTIMLDPVSMSKPPNKPSVYPTLYP